MKLVLNKNISQLLLVVSFIGGLLYFAPTAYAISSISGSNSATSSTGVALPITDIQIVGNAASSTPVKLVVSNGSLSITNTGGLGSLSGTTGSTITFTATVADANAALETLTYTRGATGSDTLEVSLVDASEVFFSGNNHLYEYIASAGDWNAANAAAGGLTRYGATGYLTTITSQEENDFAAARLGGAGWMGASDAASEGAWRWVAGPESGTQFWNGAEGGNTVGGNYSNWAAGEPNDSSGNEDCAQFLSGGSGEWNDLPCSGTSLPGYVVEFGAPGDLPTVVSKNVALETVDAPTVDTLVPADDATNVEGSDDIAITFSEVVTVGTGTVSIYRSSDGALIEAIEVTGAQVTGDGTTTITIDPTNALTDSTEYNVQIASTTFENASSIFFLGISDETTWSFTTGDYTGPVFSNVAADASNDSATLAWSTNETASTKVVYGVDGNTNLATAETNITPRVTSHSVTLTNLESCTEYSYRLVGVDGSVNSNTATSSVRMFTTEGCSSVSATRVPETPKATNPLSESDTTTDTGPADLRNLFEADKLSEAFTLIKTDPTKASTDPALVIEVLRAYVSKLQANDPVRVPEVAVRDLYLEMTGDDVRQLQELLIRESTGPAAVELARVTATGYFGNYTKNALGEYQKVYGIVPHIGYFGHITRDQMKRVDLEGVWW